MTSPVSAIEAMVPAAARRWDDYFPGGQWLYFPGDHDGEKLYRSADVLALARKAEALQRENAELREVMKECHAALKMMVTPGYISGTTVIGAFSSATSAELRARAILGGSDAGN